MDFAALPSVTFDNRRDLPASSGLYAAVVGQEVLYVGMSANLRARWKYHPLRDPLLRQGSLKIAYREVRHPAILYELERRVIKALRPPLNVQHVPGGLSRWEKLRERFYPPPPTSI